MQVRAIRGFVWNGRAVDVGETLDVAALQARTLVDGYGDCIYLDAVPPPPSAMVMTGDPEIVNGDPLVETDIKPRRRR